jgi:Xaa-Pro aminopeptidase
MDAAGFQSRRNSVARRLLQERLDALIVTALPNIRYLTGFTGSNAVLLISPSVALLFTDPRYGGQAAQETGCPVRVVRGPLARGVASRVNRKRWSKVGFEASRITYSSYETLRNLVAGGVELRGLSNWIEDLRAVKSEAEIALIRQSVETCEKAFARVVRHIRPGMRETELAAAIDYRMRKLGAERPAFETIVASGSRSALPHASATSKPLTNGELLLIDMGAQRNGYTSDMTRMLHLGRPSQWVSQVHRAVLEAQLTALDAVRAGRSVSFIDRQARKTLFQHGMSGLFLHSTGHGLGLEIHEFPRLAAGEKTRLQAGMVITIEPGVYQADFGGVRIEDTVVVTPAGCEILTTTPKELLVI